MPIDLATYRSMIGRWQARMQPRPTTTPTTVRSRPLSVATVLEVCMELIPLMLIFLHGWGSSLYTTVWRVSKVIIDGRWLFCHSVCGVSRMTCRIAPLLLTFSMVVMALLLLRGGDVESNPGPEIRLKLDDLGTLKPLLQPLSPYWISIADQLGMTSQVAVIRSTPDNTGPPAFLRDLLNRWLSREHPSPTLEALCQALRGDDEIIGGANVAKNLEEMFQVRRSSKGRGKRGGLHQGPSLNYPQPDEDMLTLAEENRSQILSLIVTDGVAPCDVSCCGCFCRSRRLTYRIEPPTRGVESRSYPQAPHIGSSAPTLLGTYRVPGPPARGVESRSSPKASYVGSSAPTLPETWNSNQHPGMSSSHTEQQCMLEHPEETNRKIRCHYANFLRDKYRSGIPSFFNLQWPPPPTQKVFNLAMITQRILQYGPSEEMVKLLLRGDVSGAMYGKSKVELKEISDSLHPKGHCNRGRKIFLIEGAPGAGKSTIAWHMCELWEKGELFQEFEILLFVQLRDPSIQSAQSLEDLFPDYLELKSEVVCAIQYCGGHNVLIVLDGWDEFPPGLDGWDEFRPGLDRKSVIGKLICDPSSLNMQFSALIITSRPIATAGLQRYATTRIEIVGFMQTEVEGYFAEAIGDPQTEKKLKDALKERPVIEACCYLPMNAAIIVHIFLASNYTLPTTLHGVFVSLIHCTIRRHLTKTGEGEKIPSILSLDGLPEDLRKQLNNICLLAYYGVLKNKVTFSTEDLEEYRLPTELSTLSLIQGVESFAIGGKSKFYNFLHLSVQELLAAFHISKLPPKAQVKIFNKLFEVPRFSAVFQFYAAFTKLQSEGVRDVVARIVHRESKHLLLLLFRCLYEAQDASLCTFVFDQLKGELDLHEVSINPVDCLSIGYFLNSVSLTASSELKVNLTECRLDRYRISLLGKELSMGSGSGDTPAVGARAEGHLHINLAGNQYVGDNGAGTMAANLKVNQSLKALSLYGCGITSTGAIALAEALKENNSLEELNLIGNSIADNGAASFGDALRVNQTLRKLNLWGCRITSTGAITLAEGLQENHSLEDLNLNSNGIDSKGAMALGDALKVNHSLKVLSLYRCDVSSTGAIALGDGLQENNSLEELNLGYNGIDNKGAMALGDALKVNHSLKTLWLHGNQVSREKKEQLTQKFGSRVQFL